MRIENLMQNSPEFKYAFERGSDPALLLLHGTGGNESSLLEIGRFVAPRESLLSPRGRSLDEGVPRFFRRLSEGVFDQNDLQLKTDELAEFVRAQALERGLALPMNALGYSNGANIALALLFKYPELLQDVIVFRPMIPFHHEQMNLEGKRVFLAAGLNDPMVKRAETDELEQILREAGASVEVEFSTSGHSLNQQEIQKAKQWLQSSL